MNTLLFFFTENRFSFHTRRTDILLITFVITITVNKGGGESLELPSNQNSPIPDSLAHQ